MKGIVTSPPTGNESLLGYLRRIGELNFYQETQSFLAAVGLRYGRGLVENIAGVERALGHPAGSLDAIAPSSDPKSAALDWRFERHHSDPVCPMCLREGVLRAQHWRHALVSACAHHRVSLLDMCPRCEGVLSPRTGGFRVCACGQDLAELPVSEASDVEIFISGLLDPDRAPDTCVEPWPNHSPPDLGRFLFFLAAHEMRSRTGKPGKASLPKTVEETVNFTAPLQYLLDWPMRFDEHVLSRMSAGNPAAASAAGRLGRWYQGFNTFTDVAYDPLRDRLSLVVAKAFTGPYPARRPQEAVDPPPFMSAAEGARKLGIRAERLVAAVRQGEVVGEQRTSGFGHTHTMLPTAEVERLVALRARAATGSEVAQILGISRKQFELIRGAGVLPELQGNGCRLFGLAVYDRAALHDRIDGIRRSAVGCSGSGVRFRDINMRKTADRASVVELVKKVFSGQIPACSTEAATLGEFHFPEMLVLPLLSTSKHGTHWTVQDVAEIAGWKPEVVAHWCRTGLLVAESVPEDQGGAYAIRPRDLARFQSTYVPLSDLAALMYTTSRKLGTELESAGITLFGLKTTTHSTRGGLVRMRDLLGLSLNAVRL